MNDFAENYWRFFMQLCLCGALKIIIMFMISMVSSMYTQTTSVKQRKQKNVIYFNMHHTSTCLCFFFSLPRRSDMRTDSNFDAFIQKQQWKKNGLACKKMEIRIPDNALERKTSISEEGRANVRTFFALPFTKQNKLKMKTALFLRQSFLFSLFFSFNVCNIKKRIDFYVSQNVRKKAGSAVRRKQ